jgi:hypothetical protein
VRIGAVIGLSAGLDQRSARSIERARCAAARAHQECQNERSALHSTELPIGDRGADTRI